MEKVVIVNPYFWHNKKVFVTGHTGFKGAWLSCILNQLGAKVTGYSLPAPSIPSMFALLAIQNTLTHIEGDICDRAHMQRAIAESEPDIIIHMAAQSLVRKSYNEPVNTFDVNLTGTLNVLEAARHVKNLKSLLIITTDKCYRNDDTGRFFVENDPLGGKDPYSASKACAEIVSQSYNDSFFKHTNVALSTARAGNVIGGGDWAEDRLIPDVVRAIGENKSVLIRNPMSTRPWQHVLEPLVGYLTLAEKMYTDGQAYTGGWNFGPNPDAIKPVGEVLDILGKTLNFKVESDGSMHPHEAKTLGLDITKVKTQLGWQPKLSISEALQWTGQWYQTYLDAGNLKEITFKQIERYLGK